MGFKRTFLALAVGLPLLAGGFAAQAQEAQLRQLFEGLFSDTPAPSARLEPVKRAPFSSGEMQLSFAPLVKLASPSVVNVYATAKVEQSPFFDDPFFGQFFGRNAPQRAQSSLGSGVVVDASGYIVTNNHVIKNADSVKVALADGREFESRIVLKDENVDLAVLKIDAPAGLAALEIGDSDALEVGDLVLAMGNPFGVGQTTTSGIVSALARTHIGVTDFGFFIQTDAAINPGNSGGALLTMDGRLAGINTAIFSQSGGSIGIGFAIPSNMVRVVVDAARKGLDHFEPPYLGATFENVTAQAAEALGLDRPTGALVTDVEQGGPAARGGLKAGDLVLEVNGLEVPHPDALGYRLATQSAGAEIAMTVFRRGKENIITVTLEAEPQGRAAKSIEISGRGPFSGTSVAELDGRLAQKLGLSAKARGVAVTEVKDRTPAAEFGFEPGDIILELNGETVESPQTLKTLAESDSRWWRFKIDRGGRIMSQVLRY